MTRCIGVVCGMRSRRIALLGLVISAASARAQLPSASTAALGMGENFTAVARGYHALAWNPALLGLAGNPGYSLSVAPLRVITGLDPITLGDLKDYQGDTIPFRVRQTWLDKVSAEGSEAGTGGADVTYIAAQVSRFGLQVSSSARAIADLNPGAVQLVLMGNTDAAGQPQSIELSGSQFNAFATSTIAASYAVPLASATGRMSFGATLKYTFGHLLVLGRDQDSQLTPAPTVDIKFPSLATLSDSANRRTLNNGSGIGLDVGFAMQRRQITLSLTVQNLFNTFKWKTDKLFFRPGSAFFSSDEHDADFEERPYAAAPDALRELVEDMKYKPAVSAGAAFDVNDKLVISADARTRLGAGGVLEGLSDGPDFHAGLGAEYRPVRYLPLRAGVALINGGVQLAAGAGVNFRQFSVSASIMKRDGELGSDYITMVTFLSAGK
jgi:hypothetical protein